MYLPAFPRIAEDLHAGDSAVQLTLTGMLLGLAVGQLVIGPLSDAFGRRRPLVVGICTHAGRLAAVRGGAHGRGARHRPGGAGLRRRRDLGGRDGDRARPVRGRRGRPDHVAADAGDRAGADPGADASAAWCSASRRGAASSWCSPARPCVLVAVAFFGLRETLPVARRRPATLRASLAAYRGAAARPGVRGADGDRRVDDGRDVRLRLRRVVRAAGRLRARRPHLRAGVRAERRRPDAHLAAQPGAAAPVHGPAGAQRRDRRARWRPRPRCWWSG